MAPASSRARSRSSSLRSTAVGAFPNMGRHGCLAGRAGIWRRGGPALHREPRPPSPGCWDFRRSGKPPSCRAARSARNCTRAWPTITARARGPGRLSISMARRCPWFAGVGVEWPAWRRLHLKLQLDTHAPFADSALKELGEPSPHGRRNLLVRDPLGSGVRLHRGHRAADGAGFHATARRSLPSRPALIAEGRSKPRGRLFW